MPTCVAGLLRPRRIDVEGNLLERLPAEVCALPRLHTLLLYRNRLRAVPPELGGAPALRYAADHRTLCHSNIRTREIFGAGFCQSQPLLQPHGRNRGAVPR